MIDLPVLGGQGSRPDIPGLRRPAVSIPPSMREERAAGWRSKTEEAYNSRSITSLDSERGVTECALSKAPGERIHRCHRRGSNMVAASALCSVRCEGAMARTDISGWSVKFIRRQAGPLAPSQRWLLP